MLFALIAIFVAVPTTSSHTRNVEIVAHRGAPFDAPENTVASAKLAWAQGADAVEADIRLTKDGELIVCHDGTTKRIDGLDTQIADLTLAEARALDVGSKKGVQFAGERMPTLDELVATVPAGKRLFVEIKTGSEILPALGASLARMQATEKSIVLISFDFEVLRQAHKLWPRYPTLWLVGYDGSTSVERLIEQARDAGLSGLDLNANFPINAAQMQLLRAAGLQLHIWTVNVPDVAQRWIGLGADGITTDMAGWMREQTETKSMLASSLKNFL